MSNAWWRANIDHVEAFARTLLATGRSRYSGHDTLRRDYLQWRHDLDHGDTRAKELLPYFIAAYMEVKNE